MRLFLQLKREELTLTCIQQFYMIADPEQPAPEATGGDPLDLQAPSYLMMPQHLQKQGGGAHDKTMFLRIFNHKYAHLKTLYSALAVGQSVIFVNSRRLAFFLALKLQKELSFSVSLICGKRSTERERKGQRERDIERERDIGRERESKRERKRYIERERQRETGSDVFLVWREDMCN